MVRPCCCSIQETGLNHKHRHREDSCSEVFSSNITPVFYFRAFISLVQLAQISLDIIPALESTSTHAATSKSQKLLKHPNSSQLPFSQRLLAMQLISTLTVPKETSYKSSWLKSRIRREDDSLLAAAYKLLPLWHQWPKTAEKLAGLRDHALWLRQGGRPADRSTLHSRTYTSYIESHGWVCSHAGKVKGGRLYSLLPTLQ